MRRGSLLLAALLLLSTLAAGTARADEFRLKDGTTIIGTVVGYQGNSFKVKTSYGFALVEKEKIASIRMTDSTETTPEKKPKPNAAKSPDAEKPEVKKIVGADEHAAVKNPAPTSTSAPPNTALRDASADVSSARVPADATTAAQSAGAATSGAQVATLVPPAMPEPQPIREQVTGNRYVNDTYEFEMYKPPDWQVMDGARSVLPGAIAAMGTDDQSTYLVIGQEAAGKSAAADIATTEKRLRDILVNFRPLDDERLTVSGAPVIAHRFRGNVDEQDWSGFMVFVPRGEKLYTIFGMTRADNDLVQIQENVIRRTISSFQFLRP